MAEVTVTLTSDGKALGRPVLYEIGKRFSVKTNIRAASITDSSAFLSVTISGRKDAVRKSLRWLMGLDLKVEAADVVSSALLAEALKRVTEVKEPAPEAPRDSVTERIYLTTPKGIIAEPIAYELGSRFDLVTNIVGASVTSEVGILSIDITGRPEVIEEAVDWLEERGVKVERVKAESP